jgi:hypothetical protein
MNSETWKLIVVFAFVLGFFAIIAIAAVRARRAAIDAIKYAIERGHPLEPAVVNMLLAQREFNPQSLAFPGIMTLALSVGLCGAAFLFGQAEPEQLYKLLGASAILVCLGVGLITASKVLPRPKNCGAANL